MLGCGTPRPRPGPRGGGQGPGKLSPLSSRSPNASFALAISARPGSPSDLPRPAAVTPVGRVSAPRWRDGRPVGLERPCRMPLLCPPPRSSFAPAPPLVPRPRPGRQTAVRLGSRERPPVTHAGHTHQVRSCSQRGRHQESRLERPGPMSRGQMAGTRPSTRSSEVPSSEASFGSRRPKEDLGTVEQGKPRSAGSRAPGSEARRRAGAGATRPSDRPSVSRGSVSQYGTVPHINIGSLIFLA